MLGSMLEYGMAHSVLHSNFLSSHNSDKCDNCEACISRYHFGARQVKNGELVFESEKCVGCGLCVTKCKNGAISMLRRKK